MNDIIKSHSERNLDEWLSYLENLHTVEIDLGLERIAKVADRLAIDLTFAKVITVAGTNGKGTTCAFIENALLQRNHTVAVYSSPHIHKFNERLRINNCDIDDKRLIAAFNQIEQSRGNISLTYYEYTTLAAFIVMMAIKPEFIVLEVGLGGRLDATNVIDADIAVLTTIDLDHQAFLGNDRETIGFEKAGIMRENQQVVVGDLDAPNSVITHARQLNTELYLRNHQFTLEKKSITSDTDKSETWSWHGESTVFSALPQPNVPIDNVASAIMVLSLLEIEVTSDFLSTVIAKTKVAGRTEMIFDHCQVMLDVGHNPLAARYLADKLSTMPYNKIHAVTGMLADKDITNTFAPLIAHVDHWYVASLDVPRGAKAQKLVQCLNLDDEKVLSFDNVVDGYKMARLTANKDDLILVFGSFYTVAHVKAFLN